MTDKLRKYVLPDIPYVFIGWAFLKLGTAYRLAAGGDFAHKFIGLGQTVGAAFADFAPGLAPFDWLVGIVGAAVFRLLICFNGLTPAPNGVRIMPFGQKELSQYLNVNRSALNRELSRMKEEGVIEMDGRAVRILKAGE